MKYHQKIRIFTALTVITVSLLLQPFVAQAKGSASVGTKLTIQTTGSITLGTSPSVLIQLTSRIGQPLADQAVELLVDGVLERRGRTDANGNLSIVIRHDMTVGTYTLTAVYKGLRSPSLAASSASTKLTIVPATIEIQTIPPLPNIKFSLDDQIFTSDAEGIAKLEVKKIGTYHLEILTSETSGANIKMEFSRWGDEIFTPYRTIQVPLDKPLDVGFEVSYLVSHIFVDLDNKPIDPARITSVTIKGSSGTTYTYEDNQPHWLPAGRVIRLSNGLEISKVLYSVISVIIDGSNVVSQAQQRFYVNPNDVWSLKLLLYSARFTARDALFRFPIGSGIKMQYPSGEIQSFAFNSANEHVNSGLARGIYLVTVTGVRGIAPPTPIALSRDQSVELIVLSYFDIGVMLSLALSLALGLLFFGQPKLRAVLAAIPTLKIPKKRISQPASFPQPLSRFTVLRNLLVPNRRATQLESDLKQVDVNNIEHNHRQGDSVLSHYNSAAEAVQTSTLLQSQDDNSIVLGESPSVLSSAPLLADEVSDATQMKTILSEEARESDTSKQTSEVETLPSVEPGQIMSDANISDSDGYTVTLDGNVNEIGNSISTEMPINLVCQACGSTQIVKNGTSRRGQQKYRCKVCGANNTFGTKRARKSRRKQSVADL